MTREQAEKKRRTAANPFRGARGKRQIMEAIRQIREVMHQSAESVCSASMKTIEAQEKGREIII